MCASQCLQRCLRHAVCRTAVGFVCGRCSRAWAVVFEMFVGCVGVILRPRFLHLRFRSCNVAGPNPRVYIDLYCILCTIHFYMSTGVRLEYLLSRKAQIDSQLCGVRRELAVAMRKQRDARTRVNRAWNLPGTIEGAVRIAYVLSDYEVEPALVFLRAVGRARRWPDLSDQQLTIMIEDVFLDSDDACVAAIADGTAPTDCESMRLALPYVREWRLVAWGRRLHHENGIAPTARMLVNKAHELGVTFGVGTSTVPIGRAVLSSARVWAGRFRDRWGAHVGALKIQDVPSVEEMRQKVCTSSCYDSFDVPTAPSFPSVCLVRAPRSCVRARACVCASMCVWVCVCARRWFMPRVCASLR